MTAIQALMERELGHLALELLEERNIAASIIPAAEKRALGIVQAIQAVLDDPSLSDFQCVDEITSLLLQAGIPTSRHDERPRRIAPGPLGVSRFWKCPCRST